MGGGSNQSPPSDVAPGGGIYPVNSFGTAYNPAWGGGTDWLSLVGGGLQKFGQGIGAGTSPIPPTGDVPQMGGQDYTQPQQPPASIPQNNLIDVLMRLLGGG